MALFVLLVLFLSLSSYGVEGRTKVSRKLQNQQNIQPTNANEFDCVDIYKQPAFDHPLLKNHKIQMNPSFTSKVMKNRKLSFLEHSNFELLGEGCPLGMVPIQKNRTNDKTNAKSLSKLHLGNIHPLTNTQPGNHFATFDSTDSGPYYGARAMISVYNPHVEMNQFSMAQIWLQNGPAAELNSIQVGWGVHPRIYGDNRTRLTTIWTADNWQKTGCYNLNCPGFVQIHPTVHLGAAYISMSVPNGKQFVTYPMVIWDKATGNWWLTVNDNLKIGYWPKEIFIHLSTGASFVRFGGWTYNSPDGLSPPMGSGFFPSKNTEESCVFGQMQIANQYDDLIDINGATLKTFVDNSSCYDLKYYGYQNNILRQAFTFGGPGGMCGT